MPCFPPSSGFPAGARAQDEGSGQVLSSVTTDCPHCGRRILPPHMYLEAQWEFSLRMSIPSPGGWRIPEGLCHTFLPSSLLVCLGSVRFFLFTVCVQCLGAVKRGKDWIETSWRWRAFSGVKSTAFSCRRPGSVPAATWRLTTIHNPSPRSSDTPFWPS